MMEMLLAAMRLNGWRVGIHNDYRLNGTAMTFWLFTHPNGTFVQGEAQTDLEALKICAEAALEATFRTAGIQTEGGGK